MRAAWLLGQGRGFPLRRSHRRQGGSRPMHSARFARRKPPGMPLAFVLRAAWVPWPGFAMQCQGVIRRDRCIARASTGSRHRACRRPLYCARLSRRTPQGPAGARWNGPSHLVHLPQHASTPEENPYTTHPTHGMAHGSKRHVNTEDLGQGQVYTRVRTNEWESPALRLPSTPITSTSSSPPPLLLLAAG